MKFVIGLLLVLSVQMVFCDFDDDDDDRPCRSDNDCERDDCCALSFSGRGKVCKDKGDDNGDRCGGQYQCGCAFGYECTPDNRGPGLLGRADGRFGTGSCQRTWFGK